MMKPIELLFPAADKTYWIDWVLTHHQGVFDIQSIERYGLPESCLSRAEQVQGYAHWLKLVLQADETARELLLVKLQSILLKNNRRLELWGVS
jgi:hypothetical protein